MSSLKCLSHRQKWWLTTGYSYWITVQATKNSSKWCSKWKVMIWSEQNLIKYTESCSGVTLGAQTSGCTAGDIQCPAQPSFYTNTSDQSGALRSHFLGHAQNAYYLMLHIRVEGSWTMGRLALRKCQVGASSPGLPDAQNLLTTSSLDGAFESWWKSHIWKKLLQERQFFLSSPAHGTLDGFVVTDGKRLGSAF